MSEEKNYPECFLGSIISPGKYWLVSKLKSHVKEVKDLEEELSDEMNKVLTLPSVESLMIHKCVAVQNRLNRGLWQRGKIIDKLENDLCQVFLIDCGYEIETSIYNIQIIKDPKYTKVEPLSFKMHLYGLVPCICSDDSSAKQVSKSWSSSAIDFINNFFSQRMLIYAREELIVDRTILGDIYVLDKPDGKLFSLRRILCMRGFAVYSETYFRDNVMEKGLPEGENCETGNFVKDASEDHDRRPDTGSDQVSRESSCESDSGSLESNCKEIAEIPLNNPKSRNSFNHSTDSEDGGEEVEKYGETNRECVTENLQRVISATSGAPVKKIDEVELIGESYSAFRIEKDHPSFDIFTRFDNCAVEPLNNFRDLNISQQLILNLSRHGNFTDLSPIQRWAIPSIQRGHNLVMIGSSKTGKTLSYIIPLIEMLYHKFLTKDISIGNGPIAVILCSESKTCEFICKVCCSLTYNCKISKTSNWTPSIEMVCGSIDRNKNTWVRLTNGCDVLITTPLSLQRLLNYKGVTNLERLSFLILDESDVISQEPHLTQVKILLHKAKISENIQTIFCGEKWIPELRNLVNTFVKNHALIIGSYLEAAIYSQIKPKVFFVENEKKLQVLHNLISEKIGYYNIMIVCEKNSEVLEIHKILKMMGQITLIAFSDMALVEKREVQDAWKYSQGKKVITCTDDAIHELCINDVELLVHYSLPIESKTNFGNRFSTIINSSITEKFISSSVIILIDDQNHIQLPHIVEFVIRLGGKMPDNIMKVSNEIKRGIEMSKKEEEICVNLLRFGDCKKTWKCPKRHTFINEIDSSERFICGILKFRILNVHSPSHFSIRIIELTDGDNKKSVFEDLSTKISDRLNDYYSSEENRLGICSDSGSIIDEMSHQYRRAWFKFIQKILGEVKMNYLCGAKVSCSQSETHSYHRAKIVELKKVKGFKNPTEVVIKLLDCGLIVKISVYQLFELPEDSKADPPQCSSAFLCNLLPSDFDADYSEEALSFSEKLFLEEPDENQYWMGVIKLSLNSILFLEPVKLCHTLEKLNTQAVDFDARRKLLSNEIAVENNHHLDKIYSLCEEAGIKIAKFEYKKDEDTIIKPEKAFLPQEPVQVRFLIGDNPSSLFFRIRKFEDLLGKLEKECEVEVDKFEKDPKALMPNWKAGMHCLACDEGSWIRARIEKRRVNEFFVYFIDHGSFKYTDNIFPITEKLLLQLPAQAIECYITGTENADLDKTMNLTKGFLESKEDELKALALEKDSESAITGGRKYGINLLCKNGKSLIKMLIDSGLIVTGENCSRLAEDNEIVPSDAEEVNDEEEESSSLESWTEDNLNLEKDSAWELSDDEDDGYDGDESNFLKPDAFDDENAQFMLEEFMSHFMPGAMEEDSKSEGTNLETQPEMPEMKMDEGPEENVLRFKKTSRQFLKQYLSKNCNKKLNILPPVTYTPEVLWSQNHTSIRLKIMLNNVKTFKLDCSPENFVLRCLLDNKLYLTDLKFFGSIDPPGTLVKVKTFFLSICLRKLSPLLWPRLPRRKQKFRWIKYDVEEYIETKNTLAEDLCKQAMTRIETGNLIVPEIVGDVRFVPSTDSDRTSTSVSESDDGDYFI